MSTAQPKDKTKIMKTQVKLFSIKLLEDLIDSSHFINITNGNRDLNVVSRFDLGIQQEMLYAVEKSNGEFTIFNNNLINTLIFEMGPKEERNNPGPDIRRKRYLSYLDIRICILESDSIEEIRSFKLITKQA